MSNNLTVENKDHQANSRRSKTGGYFSAITSISKFSVERLSFLLKAPSFAPKISTVEKFSDFNSQLNDFFITPAQAFEVIGDCL